jgi:LPXTG-site transpeptidase (sortase) family protein
VGVDLTTLTATSQTDGDITNDGSVTTTASAPPSDTDGDGMYDVLEGTGDRDGDTIPNDLDYDPTGYFYDEATGEIISGGLVSASGPGAITTFQTGASGYYQFATDGTPGTYTLAVTLPPGYDWSDTCLQSDPPAYDPTGNPDPDVLGAGEDGSTGYLTSNACTSFYLTLDLAAGDPFIINNNLPLQARPLPDTGFAPGQVSTLPAQPAEKAHQLLGALWLEVPSLDVRTSLVGVPSVNGEWDVTWLGNQAGYLMGTAFPTWTGNTVITGHVWNPDNQPGIFIDLKDLSYGEQIRIHAWGDVYTYQVVENRRISPFMAKSVLEHKDSDYVTLLTCEDFGEYWGDYGYRRMVGAILVDISPAQ